MRSSPQAHWDPSSAFTWLHCQFWQQDVVFGSIKAGCLAAACHAEFTRICWLSAVSPCSISYHQSADLSEGSEGNKTSQRCKLKISFPSSGHLVSFHELNKALDGWCKIDTTSQKETTLGSDLQSLYFFSFLLWNSHWKTCTFQIILLLEIHDPSNPTHDNCHFTGRIFNFQHDINILSAFCSVTKAAKKEPGDGMFNEKPLN